MPKRILYLHGSGKNSHIFNNDTDKYLRSLWAWLGTVICLVPGHVRLSDHGTCCHVQSLDKNNIYSMEMCHNKERPSSTTTTGNGGLRTKYCESFALLILFLLHFYGHYGHCSSSFPLFLSSPLPLPWAALALPPQVLHTGITSSWQEGVCSCLHISLELYIHWKLHSSTAIQLLPLF